MKKRIISIALTLGLATGIVALSDPNPPVTISADMGKSTITYMADPNPPATGRP